MNFQQLRIQRNTPKEITMPECGMTMWVKPVSVFDLALAGDIPPALMQDLSDLDKQATATAQLREEGQEDMQSVLDNAQKTAAFSRKLIKQIVVEQHDTPRTESWQNDDNLNLIPIGDLIWFRAMALAGFTDDVLYPDPEQDTEPEMATGRIELTTHSAGADFPEYAAG